MGSRSRKLHAGGAVVTRPGAGELEVLVVHRPNYDDWCLPKGKLNPDEDAAVAAVREVAEETGIDIRLSRPLGRLRYPVNGDTKTVSWWLGVPTGGRLLTRGTPPTKSGRQEIDRCRWWPLSRAQQELTYPNERELLADPELLVAGPTVLLVRHGKAMQRRHWSGKDWKRPLSSRGRRQAQRLECLLGAYGVSQLVSSSSTRCVQTLQPYAASSGLTLVTVEALSEEAYEDDEAASTEAMAAVVSQALHNPDAPLAVCGHRPLLPMMRHQLGVVEESMLVGETLVVHFDSHGQVVAAESVKSAY